ncbi:hypothetical protein C1H76_2143 [Elsinoe australis]|uniref:AB hydrolase-1 domain-containing protein n=1 Tax=Elsinoe australis TaxID=40998 RepID=A0A4U7B2N3_9PEZI|nr:hypothetical protein C1H76_2143 [Elsinoe australis]
MAATDNKSLSATTQISNNEHPAKLSQYSGLEHPPAVDALPGSNKLLCKVKPLEIKVQDGPDGSVPGFLHIPQNYRREEAGGREKTAAILLSGAGGGVVGPSSIYLSMADKLACLRKGIPVLRMDYRYPARNKYCVPDVLAAMDYLQNGWGVSRFVLVGWSFGGAPVFTVGGKEDRIVGCATVASQTAETDGIQQVARKGLPLLLLHGTGDRTLSSRCSQDLYDSYGHSARGGQSELKLFDGDDHALTKSSLEAENLLSRFIMRCAGVEIGEDELRTVVQKSLVDDKEKIEKMKQGGDLRGKENVE